jgi:hypothetical protein
MLLSTKEQLTLRILDSIGTATAETIAKMGPQSHDHVLQALALLRMDELVGHDQLGDQPHYFVTSVGRDWLLEREPRRRTRHRTIETQTSIYSLLGDQQDGLR